MHAAVAGSCRPIVPDNEKDVNTLYSTVKYLKDESAPSISIFSCGDNSGFDGCDFYTQVWAKQGDREGFFKCLGAQGGVWSYVSSQEIGDCKTPEDIANTRWVGDSNRYDFYGDSVGCCAYTNICKKSNDSQTNLTNGDKKNTTNTQPTKDANKKQETKPADETSTESTQSGCVNTVGQRECKDGEHKGYFVCESDDDCLINKTLPAHAIDGHCVSAGRNGYKICTATDCNDGWIAKGGWCQKDTISTQEGETTVAEETEEINPAPPAIETTEFTELEKNCPNSDGDENECEQTEGPDQDQNSAQLNEVTPVGPSPNNESTESKEEATQQETQEVQETDNKALNNTDNQSQPETTQPTPKPTAAELEEKLKTAQDALKKAQDKENSWANRAVSATSTAASGVGGMMTASALAERAADKDAEAEMQEYISTMKCEYGKEQQFNFGTDEITLPGGNELLEYYTEYKTLADNLKTTKAALGLRPGIESEVLYDRAQSGLYQYSGATRQTGGETSLFRALTDESSADAAAWADQKDKTKTKLTAGGVTAGVGVIGGATGNYFINRDKKEADSKK